MLKEALAALLRVENSVESLDPEPRWPAFIAVLAVGGIYMALPDALTLGPRWLFPSLILALLFPTVVSHHTGRHRLNTIFAFLVAALLTIGLTASVILLIGALPARRDSAGAVAFGGFALGHQYLGFCSMVLATGRRRPAPAG